jgi:hypothetical protein
MEYAQFKPGQKVHNLYGETLTVLFQDGCYVKVVEELLGHYHPSKLFPIDGPLAAAQIEIEGQNL